MRITVVTCTGALAVALLSSVAARAEVTLTKTDDELTIVRMSVTPAAEPAPALKYRFTAHDIDLKPGNAAPYYHRALLNVRYTMQQMHKKYGDEYDDWSDNDPFVPLANLPLEELRDADRWSLQGHIQDQLNEATLRSHCDWELGVERLRGLEAISFALDEFQSSRNLCRMLVIRARLYVAEHQYADAIGTIRQGYRLARDFSNAPFLVCGLIGIAEAQTTNMVVRDLIASPGSPNLYWALTELPRPLIDMQRAARIEMDFGPRMFPFIDRAEITDRSPQEWNRLFTRSMTDLSSISDGFAPEGNDLSAGIYATGFALLGYSYAKERLLAEGLDPASVEAMSVGQVMAIYTERNYQSLANEYEKLWYVPFWEMRARKKAIEKRVAESRPVDGGGDREVLPIAQLLLPATDACRTAQVRLEREIAALRVIEALRMYAASHAGGLPKSLDEITEVPVPLNPATGKSFEYFLDGRSAILDLPESDGVPNATIRYEISIARSE
jgi:hypothetical protein